MVALPQLSDPTLEAADRALEAQALLEPPRGYWGLSSAGEECARKSWYSFRWAWPSNFDATTLKRFADGHRTEALIVSRLKMAPGVVVEEVDPTTGQQFEFIDIDGHAKGHSDGRIRGLYQAPKTPHVLEIKCVNDKKQAELVKLVETVGEKNALRAWDMTYYVQHILYMYYEKYTRGYLVAASPGGRSWVSVRTNSDDVEAQRQLIRARVIIYSDTPPAPAYKNAEFYKCRWCQYKDLCWGKELPKRNCRTCMFSRPVDNGQWQCTKFDQEIPLEQQRKTHECHRYIPDLVHSEQIDAAEDGEWVQYSDYVDRGPE